MILSVMADSASTSLDYALFRSVMLLTLAALMAFARVFVGAHYPGDILGGALLGVATSTGLSWLAERRLVETKVAAFFALLCRLRLAAPISRSQPNPQSVADRVSPRTVARGAPLE